MIIYLKVEHGKDSTGQRKRVLWTTVETEIEGMGKIVAVNELQDETPLAKEIDYIVSEMMALKTAQIREKNNRLLAKRKK